MKYYAVFLPMKDPEKSKLHRQEHLQYLDEMRSKGSIFANGRFTDGTGGLVIYKAENEAEVEAFANEDPYVIHGARDFEIHEWEMVLGEK